MLLPRLKPAGGGENHLREFEGLHGEHAPLQSARIGRAAPTAARQLPCAGVQLHGYTLRSRSVAHTAATWLHGSSKAAGRPRLWLQLPSKLFSHPKQPNHQLQARTTHRGRSRCTEWRDQGAVMRECDGGNKAQQEQQQCLVQAAAAVSHPSASSSTSS